MYREICEKLEYGINKLYLYQVQALSDNVLTNEEIEESMRIVEEVNKAIAVLKANIETSKVKKCKKGFSSRIKKRIQRKAFNLKIVIDCRIRILKDW